jgi:hypothetical protein
MVSKKYAKPEALGGHLRRVKPEAHVPPGMGPAAWLLALKHARARAVKASGEGKSVLAQQWHMVMGHIADAMKAEGWEAPRPQCACKRDLINPDYCPYYGDHKYH